VSGDVLLAVAASRRVLKFATLADFAARLAVSFGSAFSLFVLNRLAKSLQTAINVLASSGPRRA